MHGGLHLPALWMAWISAKRAMMRHSRQGWLLKSQQHKADAVVTSPRALSANVRKGSDVLSEMLAEGNQARSGSSAYDSKRKPTAQLGR